MVGSRRRWQVYEEFPILEEIAGEGRHTEYERGKNKAYNIHIHIIKRNAKFYQSYRYNQHTKFYVPC